ncbi:MAG TPA: hypothetical protein VEJ86_03160 [Candidatus Binataceae bacterium]|nr:hypothetical protein [Candidatus Binataceae bacterium]
MPRASKFTDPTDEAICEVNRRFVEVMETIRLETLSADTKERYLKIMTKLTEQLAIPAKPLHEIIGEIMAEAGPMLFQLMQR